MKYISMIVALLLANLVYAQNSDSYIELLKSEVKTGKKTIVSETMAFTDQQAAVFWPLYSEFEKALDELNNERIANIKEFAANYDNLNDEKADDLIKKSFEFLNDRLSLNKKYYNKFAEVLSPTVAAKFIQLEHQIQLVGDLSIASNLPLVKKTDKK